MLTSLVFVNLTLATLRRAEFGFFGVVVYTRVQTPRFCGHDSSAGEAVFVEAASRPMRTSWLMVGIERKFRGRAADGARSRSKRAARLAGDRKLSRRSG